MDPNRRRMKRNLVEWTLANYRGGKDRAVMVDVLREVASELAAAEKAKEATR